MTGIRRCGKSTMFEIYQNYLRETGIAREQIISVNLEEADYRNIRTAEQLYEYIDSKLQKDRQNYVFVDEIQQVEDFQQSVDWLYVKKNVDLYITGSNAFLLSGELATLLSGRYVEIKMLPLSFKEYISAFPENANTAALYMNYLTNSSFPGTLERELSSLDAVKDHNPKYLLTMDYTPVSSHNGIKQLNVIEWLLK